MTIHQPSSRLFHMFDRLLVLSEGRPVFSGQARDAMEYFCSRGFIPSIPMNPTDFVLDLATGDISMISTPLEPSITMGNQTAKEIQQMVIEVGFLFYLLLYWASTGLFCGVFVFPIERELLAKGRSSNMYRLSAYYMSSTLCDTVAQIFYATIFYCIVYFMANFQRTASAFLLTLLGLYLVIFTAHGTGELIGAAVPDIRRTGLVASIVLLVFMITGGFYIQDQVAVKAFITLPALRLWAWMVVCRRCGY